MYEDKECFEVKHGDIILVNIPEDFTRNVISGKRPCIVVSNNIINQHSSVYIVVPMTGNTANLAYSHNVLITSPGLNGPGVARCDQITSIDKSQIIHKISHLTDPEDAMVMRKLLLVLNPDIH